MKSQNENRQRTNDFPVKLNEGNGRKLENKMGLVTARVCSYVKVSDTFCLVHGRNQTRNN